MNSLSHHGILGQKWGVRRYQNPDGSLTPDGQKRYLKSMYKEARKEGSYSFPYDASEKFKKMATEYVSKSMTNEQKEKLSSLRKEARDKESKRTKEFDYGTKEYDELIKEADKQTYEWFEKNDPEYLKEIIKNNNGEKAGLNAFHDYRKLYEGTYDMLYDEYEEKWKQNNKDALISNKAADKAWDNYIDQQRQIINDIVGEYGNTKLHQGLGFEKLMDDTTLSEKIYWNTPIQDILDDYEKHK